MSKPGKLNKSRKIENQKSESHDLNNKDLGKQNLEKLRHSASHLLAAAVLELYPEAKRTIGPAIETGFYYDFDNLQLKEQDLEKIEAKMREIVKSWDKFERKELSSSEAKKFFKDNPYKIELIEEFSKQGEKLSLYSSGKFTDLCKGNHIDAPKNQLKYFKLLSIAGAYWRGDSKNKMLTRIYGTAFPSQKELDDFIKQREEAEKRNHIKLGKELGLFTIHPEGPGFPFFHPRGMIVWNELMKYWKEEHDKEGYVEVKTPIILNKQLWQVSGHWDYYKQNMYTLNIDNEDYAIKPMNCPGGILIYKSNLHSYKELPLKIAEIGQVHRHELSGVLNGLFRVRTFHQDDSHIFCTKEQITQEVVKVIKLIDKIYRQFNLTYHLELSTKPEKSIGSKEEWDLAESALKAALKEIKADYKLNPGEGAFYGPKIDFHIKDSLGRTWQCGTIQLDFFLPERFDLTYEGNDGRKHRVIMLHRVVYGAVERFLGILIEHYAGHFPLWLSPVQVKIVTVNDKCIPFAQQVESQLKQAGIRAELDSRAESIGKKVRDAEAEKIPITITIGEKEVSKKALAIREQGKVKFDVPVEDFLAQLKERIEKRI